MFKSKRRAMVLAGSLAGAVNGLLGAGGGMLLIPLLHRLARVKEEALFPTSVSIMLPVSLVSLVMTRDLPWDQALPWLLGSAAGGLLAGAWGRKIPVLWLHRGLGILILWGGVRYLWP